ncbi:MAG: anti-sigma factor [Candidatus Euphemobacter frigidus]|nr:anti-sigma factor [Candidatus Euphemobacter frigidus]MDP8274987.1 anti-sigma factor [Candidatus Euphemobacter frigidus]
MNCRKFKKVLTEYLYGEISARKRENFMAHASSCPECRRLLREMIRTVSLLKTEERSHFSAGEMAALRVRVKEEIERPDQSPVRSPGRFSFGIIFRPRLLPVAGALAVAVLVIFTVLLVLPSAKSPRSSIPVLSNGANDLVAMTEVVEDEFQSVAEICGEIDALQSLFLNSPEPGSEVGIPVKETTVPA